MIDGSLRNEVVDKKIIVWYVEDNKVMFLGIGKPLRELLWSEGMVDASVNVC